MGVKHLLNFAFGLVFECTVFVYWSTNNTVRVVVREPNCQLATISIVLSYFCTRKSQSVYRATGEFRSHHYSIRRVSQQAGVCALAIKKPAERSGASYHHQPGG